MRATYVSLRPLKTATPATRGSATWAWEASAVAAALVVIVVVVLLRRRPKVVEDASPHPTDAAP